MIRLLKRYPLSVLCIALTWYLCLFKPPRTSFDTVQGFDKVVHVCMYLGTCSLIWCEYLRHHERLSRKRLLIWGIAAPIAMSGLIELVQAYCTTTRSGDWLDFAANSIGVLIAAVLGQTVYCRYVHPKHSRK